VMPSHHQPTLRQVGAGNGLCHNSGSSKASRMYRSCAVKLACVGEKERKQ